MKVGKSVKIAIFLLLMFIMAYPTFLALATVQFLIWWYLTKAPFGEPILGMNPSGYYLLPLVFICAIVFFTSLFLLIKTIRSKNTEKL